MAIRLMGPIVGRIILVLQDYLPAELDLIDAYEAANGGISLTTPDILYWNDWDRMLIPEYPAFSARTVSSLPIDVKPDTFGQRITASHRIDLMFHATMQNVQGSNPRDLQAILHRYIAGAARVLCVMKERLQTVSDPTEWGSPGSRTVCRWQDEATYGPETEQEGGAIVRTATLPVRVERAEVR
jgi:hypothetical protein